MVILENYALVGTPEAVCLLISCFFVMCNVGGFSLPGRENNACDKHKKFCEWLGGLVDADGSLQLSKASYGSLEITVQTKDRTLLIPIQQKYGGAIKPRAGVNAVRYRLHHKQGLV